MRGVVLLGFLEALLLGFTRLLLAGVLRVVGRGIPRTAPTEQTQRTEQHATQGGTAGSASREGARQAIEACFIHRGSLGMMRLVDPAPS
jgi:hypothetical protein